MGREQRLVFGEVADLYDRARPGYPEALVDDVVSYARLTAGDQVLEVGCGTGKATVPFAARARVTALDPDPDMASIAQRNCAGLDAIVEVASFENWMAEPGGYRLVIAAQSWHWVQPAVRLLKAREVLAADGALALFWNRPDWPETPLRHAIDAVYERVAPELGARTPGKSPQDVGRRVCVEELSVSDLFGEVTAIEHEWDTVYDRDTYLQLLDTSSDHRLLDPEKRQRLFDEVGRVIDVGGGVFPVRYVAELYLARPAG
jgi:trans-aconitate methyltransferase